MTFAARLSAVMLTFALPFSVANSAEPEALKRDFIEFATSKYGLSKQYVEASLAKAKKNDKVIAAIQRPWEAKPWHQYYPIFLTEKRVAQGVEFWQAHADTLARATAETGVPAEIIVAILGVETFYGRITGNYPVLDSLYSLGFYYPKRGKFFRKELAEFLTLSKEQGFDIEALNGSYAGAMGWGQFISSSYRHYAVDFDNDGVTDILTNPVDAIGSVANYFKMHKWQPGQAVIHPASLAAGAESPSQLINKKLNDFRPWSDIASAGIQTELTPKHDQRFKLIALEQAEHTEYWLAEKNFYVITRYNHSPLYAMAVYQLSQQIKARKLAG